MEYGDTMVIPAMKKRNTEVGKFLRVSASRLLLLPAAVIMFLTVCIAAPASGAGGDVVWQLGDAKAGKQESKAMAVDSSGNVIITGYQTVANSDYYTVKMKADGSGVAWTAFFDKSGGDDQAVAVAVDSDDNVIVTGFVQTGLKLDIHTIKYDGTNGTVLWQHTYNGAANGNDEASSVAVDEFNNVYVGGHIQKVSGNEDYALLKYSPGGALLWEASYDGGGQDRILSVAAGIDGVAVTGYSWNGTDFDYYTIKYGFDSIVLWEKRYSSAGINNDRGLLTRTDTAGNVIVTGYISNGSDMDIYTVKYGGAAGDVLWEATRNGGFDDEPRGLWIGANGNVYVTGYTWTLTGHYDFYTARYQGSGGALLWEKIFNSGTDNDDIAVGITVDSGGDVFVTGYTTSSGNYDFQTVKYEKETGNQLWQANFNGSANRNERPSGIGLSPAGEPLVAGWSDMWTSGASDYDYYAIHYDPGSLNAPTNLSATAVSTGQINLAWDDNSSNEDGFRIERKIGSFDTPGVVTTIDIPVPGTNTYSDSGLAPDTRYYYRVRAYNVSTGNSHYSNVAHALTTIVSYAPPSWRFTYDAEGGDDYAMAIATGPDRHPVVTGFSFTTATSFDYYTLKLNRADGNILWSARYDDPDNDLDAGMCVAVDGNNEVIVSGYSSLYSAAAGQNTNDVYTIKYRSTGEPELWNDTYDGPAHNDDRSTAVSTAVDGSNSIIVVGYGRNLAFDDDIYVIKYLPDGTRAWVAEPFNGGGNDYPSAVVIDPSNSIYVTGFTHNGTNYDFFTRKYDSAGNIVWTDIFPPAGGNGNDVAKSLALDSSGNLYVAGSVVNAFGNEDFYTIKYNAATGARLWERFFDGAASGNDQALAVSIDPIDGNSVVSGTTLTGAGNNDYHVIRYDADGNVVWQKTLQRPANDDYVVAMGMDLSGNICVAGNTHNGSNLDIMSIKYTYEGNIIGATIFNGTANNNDMASGIAVNSLGEAFIAGESINGSGNADYAVFKCAWDSLQVPAPFTATAAYTEVVLTWQDNSTSEDGFYIEKKSGSCSSGNPWVLNQTLPPNQTAFTDFGLNAGEYCFRIQAFRNNGETSRWLEKSVTTSTPPVPLNLTATAVTTTRINLSWDDMTAGETGFLVERCEGDGCSVFTQIGIAGADARSFSSTGLKPATSYSYRIRASKDGRWVTGYSNTATAVTVINMPDTVTATAVNTTQIGLSWTDRTGDETGFLIERCKGEGCSDFSQIAATSPDAQNYSDTGVCHTGTYRYRLKPVNEGFSNRGGGCWVKRKPLTVTGFQPEFQTRLTVTYDSDMQNDFDDIRFYDETAKIELPYWIESKTNGSSATVWIKTGPSNTINMYYGNPSAASSSSGTQVFEFFDEFNSFDAAKWTATGAYSFASGLMTLTTGAVYSNTPVASQPNMVTEARMRWSNFRDHSGIEISDVQTTSGGNASANKLAYFMTAGGNSSNVNAYAADGSSGSYNIANGAAQFTASSGVYYIVGHAVTPSQVIFYRDRTALNSYAGTWSSPYYLWFGYFAGAASGSTDISDLTVDWALVRKFAATMPSVTAGAEETSAVCYAFASAYDGPYSSIAEAVTPTPLSPDPLAATRASEVQINLGWADNTSDETGFEVLRCAGSGCTPSDPPLSSAGPGVIAFSNTGLQSSATYRYMVRAYKTAAGCTGGRWAVDSSIAEAVTSILPPDTLDANPVNTTRIDLSWNDRTASETGFRIERCEGAGCSTFSPLATTVPGGRTYSDTSVCKGTSYTYRAAAVNEGLSGNGGGCWTRRKPLTITNFQADFQVKVTIAYDSDMQADFDDIRFFDETAKIEVPYWIESKTDGSAATVWIRTLSSNSISMYYGNPGAVSSGNGSNVFAFFDDFSEGVISTGKWSGNSFAPAHYSITDGVLKVWSDNATWKGLNSLFTSVPSEAVSLEMLYKTENLNNIHLYLEEANNRVGLHPYYSGLTGPRIQYRVSGGSFINDSQYATTAADTWYIHRLDRLNPTSFRAVTYNTSYAQLGSRSLGSQAAWNVVNFGFNIAEYSSVPSYFDWVRVRKYAATEPAVTPGAEENIGACYSFSNTWVSTYSNEDSATTPTPTDPGGLSATAISESQIDLVWDDTNTDETGYSIERKSESCSLSTRPFLPLVPLTADFDAGIDAGLWNQQGVLYDSAGGISQDLTAPPIDITDGNGTARVTASGGAVELYTTSSGGGTAGFYNNSRLTLKSPGVIQGDFDLQIDYSLPDGQITSGQYHVYTRLLITFPTTSGANNAYIERYVDASGNYYASVIRVNGVATPGSLATGDVSGKLRIRRSGSTISAFVWTGGAWTLIREVSGASTSAATGVTAIQYSQRNEAVSLKANIDNFVLGVSNADRKTLTDTSLDSGKTYCYRVRTYKTAPCGWQTGYSNSAEATTLAPPAPTNLKATPVNTTQIDLSWDDNTGTETGFVIQRCTGTGCTDFTDLGSVGANIRIYSDSTVCKDTSYRYQVRATRNTPPTFDTAYSNIAPAKTPDVGNMLADWDFENTTTAWTGTSGTQTGTSFDASVFYSGGKSLKLSASGATLGRTQTVTVIGGRQYVLSGYLNTSLTAGAAQCDVQGTGIDSAGIRIAFNGANNNAGWVYLTETVTIPGATTSVNIRCFADSSPQGTAYIDLIQFAPSPLVTLTATRASEIQINLAWNDNFPDETGFRIERCADSSCNTVLQTITVGPNTTSYSDVWLLHSTTYYYRVQAYKTAACGWNSLYSNIANATTSISAPASLSAGTPNTTQVNLSWTATTTASETGFKIDRCADSSCNTVQQTFTVGPNVTSYSDTSVCSATGYYFRVKAYSDGLLSSGGGCWTRRVPLAITNFQPDFLSRIVIAYDSDMQPDFDDLRIYDATHGRELPYWIESKTDGVSATIWIKTGSNNNIYMYYGNASATGMSSLAGVFGSNLMGFWQFNEAAGTVSGATSDISGQGNHGTLNNFAAPNGIVGSGRFGNALRLDGTNDYVSRGSTALPTGNIATAEAWIYPMAYADATYNGIVSWGSRSCTGLAAALSIQNNGRPSMATWCNDFVPPTAAAATLNAWNHIAVVLSGTSVTLYMNGQPVSGTLTNTPNIQTGNLSIGALDYPGRYFNGLIDEVRIYNRALSASEIASRYASADPVLVPGAEEQAACFAFVNSYEGPYSNIVLATTPTPATPVLTATRGSEVLAKLSWTDANTDETGYSIERCEGSGCSGFGQIGAVNANIFKYDDFGLKQSTTYFYKVKAYKTATCGWVKESAVREVTTSLSAPDSLAATPVNTTRIDLSWNDTTGGETGFAIWKCTDAGSACSDFSQVDMVRAGEKTYSDTTVCNTKTYRYKVQAVNEGLSNGNSGCWTRRAPLTISDFLPNFQTKVIVGYDADMQTDFDDIRFYDETGKLELPYYIESKIDGVSATVFVRTGQNNNVYLYYGNPNAAGAGNGDLVFEFFDDFSGTGIDANKWTITDGTGFTVSGGNLRGTNTTGRLTSKTTFSEGVVQEIKARTTAVASNGQMIGGFYLTSSNNIGWAILGNSYYRNNSSWVNKGDAPPANNLLYTIKVMNAATTNLQIYNLDTAAVYWAPGDIANAVSNEPVVLGKRFDDCCTNQTYATDWDWVRIRKYAQVEPSAGIGAEESLGGPCYSFTNTWGSPFSNEAAATTPTPSVPSGLITTAVTDQQVDLLWTDTNSDETGFRVQRCTGAGCSDFGPLGVSGTTSYSDTTAQASLTYCYIVNAYKTAVCGWETGYGSAACDLSFSARPTSLVATALNAFTVRLDWDDVSVDEDGFEVEVQIWNGRWVKIGEVGIDIRSYVDTMGIEPQKTYKYRVRAFRSADRSPYSNEASATTPAYTAGAQTCP